jgi:sigma-E factor negative regulatory protein RseA
MSIMNAADMNSKSSNPLESLSALADGELESASLRSLFADIEADPQSMGAWHTYQVIGDALRSSDALVSGQAPGEFLAGFRERLKMEGAAGLAQPTVVNVASAPTQAANDAVFRWKMVAGVASMAAVLAVSWNLMGGLPQGDGGVAGPQLAAGAPAPASPAAVVPVASVAPAATSTELAVNTGQGVLIRDARLEELLAEHRQHGGMSALQMPTGFIRGATYDASGR